MKIKNLHLILIVYTAFVFQFSTSKVQAQESFLPATTFAIGSSPYSLISADLNGDGKADLAVISNFNGTGNVSVLLGNGSGGFGNATNFAVGTNPTSISSADFNCDGAIDLVVTNYYDNNVSVLLGNGLGGFATATNFAVGVNPVSLTTADFNSDGKADLAIVNIYSNVLSVLLGNGAGSFDIVTNFTVGSNPNSITCADYNEDGKIDLALTYLSSNSISLLLGDGIGNFSVAAYFAISGNYGSIISADFNGDGHVDLASANQSSDNVSELLGNGAGSFSAPTDFMVGNAGMGSGKVFCADYNGDGIVDLAVTNYNDNNVSLLVGNGGGGFASATNFVVGGNPTSLTGADFNGDGKIDLAVANFNDNNLTVLLNNYLPPAAPICLVTVDSTLTHNVVVWEKTNLNMAAVDSFIIYREIATNNYQAIGAVSKDSLSTFDDFDANPASTAFRYKLKNKNSQGVLSLFSAYHNTMYLTHAGADFSWTPYQIENTTTPVSAYKVYRDNNATGNFQSIGTTTGNQLGFTDVNYASYPNSSYYVEAVMNTGVCEPTRTDFVASRSNVKYRGIAGVQQLNNHSTINIYPNPTGNTLNISGITGKTTLFLYDIVGKLLMKKEVENNATISISQLEDGIYTLLSESKADRAFNKVVISR